MDDFIQSVSMMGDDRKRIHLKVNSNNRPNNIRPSPRASPSKSPHYSASRNHGYDNLTSEANLDFLDDGQFGGHWDDMYGGESPYHYDDSPYNDSPQYGGLSPSPSPSPYGLSEYDLSEYDNYDEEDDYDMEGGYTEAMASDRARNLLSVYKKAMAQRERMHGNYEDDDEAHQQMGGAKKTKGSGSRELNPKMKLINELSGKMYLKKGKAKPSDDKSKKLLDKLEGIKYMDIKKIASKILDDALKESKASDVTPAVKQKAMDLMYNNIDKYIKLAKVK